MKSRNIPVLDMECVPPLETGFAPAALVHRNFLKDLHKESTKSSLRIGLERSDGSISVFHTDVFSQSSTEFGRNFFVAERLVKFLLWQRGGFRVYVGGPSAIGDFIADAYRQGGVRAFDAEFMGPTVCEKPFEIIVCKASEVPQSRETSRLLGRHLDGCRIGFDLGASDRKVSSVIDGEAVYSEEVIWEPRKHHDPNYHYEEIMKALQSAAGHMPRVDAIGGSSAGIYIDNRPMVASLFRGVPEEKFGDVKNLFVRIQQEMGVPLQVINDGDVTALAGSMSLNEGGVLGVALGSSEAAGYVDQEGRITGWLNELAFAPIDYAADAAVDEWSKDQGCGASYLSQQCVFRLALKASIAVDENLTDAEKLKHIQTKLEEGDSGAQKIWQSMGIFLGYAIAHYAQFYWLKHVLILGRCTSGKGGALLLSGAKQVLGKEFPQLAQNIELHLPDEKIRRVGQSIAAASLPMIV